MTIHNTISRYSAICKPLAQRTRSSPGKAKKIIGKIWLLSFISAAPWAAYTKVQKRWGRIYVLKVFPPGELLGVRGLRACGVSLVQVILASDWLSADQVTRILTSDWSSIPFNEEAIGSMYLMLAATTLYFIIPMFTVTFIYIRWGQTFNEYAVIEYPNWQLMFCGEVLS